MDIKAYFMEVNENGVVFAGRLGWIQNTFDAFQDYLKMLHLIALWSKMEILWKSIPGI